MPQEAVTFRPRSGATATLAAGATQSIPLPAWAHNVTVVCTLAPGRVAIGEAASAPALADANYGYMGANIPLTLKPSVGRDKYLYIGSGIASNVFYITFGN